MRISWPTSKSGVPVPSRGEADARRAASWWDRFESGSVLTIAAILFLASTVVMLSEGFNRSVRDVSFFWAEETVRFLMIWAFFLTLGVAGTRGLHIRTELLVDVMPVPVRRAMHLLAIIAGGLFSAVLFAASVPQLMRYYSMGMMSESSLDIPQWVVFLAMPLGAGLWFGYYLRCFSVWIRGGDAFATGGVSGSEP